MIWTLKDLNFLLDNGWKTDELLRFSEETAERERLVPAKVGRAGKCESRDDRAQ